MAKLFFKGPVIGIVMIREEVWQNKVEQRVYPKIKDYVARKNQTLVAFVPVIYPERLQNINQQGKNKYHNDKINTALTVR